MPGFTPISMYPRMWAASGVGLPELVDRLIASALRLRLGYRAPGGQQPLGLGRRIGRSGRCAPGPAGRRCSAARSASGSGGPAPRAAGRARVAGADALDGAQRGLHAHDVRGRVERAQPVGVEVHGAPR